MGDPALILEDAAGEEAVRQTVRLTLIEGGASAAEAASAVAAAEAGGAVAAGEIATGGAVAAAEAGGAVAAGEAAAGGAAAAGIGGAAIATAGIALVVVGLAALGYYLYKRSTTVPTESEPQVPATPDLISSCPTSAVSSGPAKAVAPTPAGLTAGQEQLWRTCKDLHDKYKSTQREAAADAPKFKILKQRLITKTASEQDRLDFCWLLGQRLRLLERLYKQRQEYIGRGCDQFDWLLDGSSMAERLESHTDALNQLENQLNNVRKLREEFCGD